MKNVIVLGDSILAGIIYDDINAKYDNIGECNINAIAKRYQINIVNKSVFGLTTNKALKRNMHTKFCKMNENKNCDIMLIALGGNDCDHEWKEIASSPYGIHQPKTMPNRYKDNLNKIISELRLLGVMPILTTLTPIIATKYLDWVTRDCNKQNVLIWLKNVEHIYMWQEMYSNIAREVAFANNVTLIDTRKAFLMQNNLYDFMCNDGIHLNKNGHKLLTETFIDFIENNKHLL